MGWKGDRQILLGSRKPEMAVTVAVMVKFLVGRRNPYAHRPVSLDPSWLGRQRTTKLLVLNYLPLISNIILPSTVSHTPCPGVLVVADHAGQPSLQTDDLEHSIAFTTLSANFNATVARSFQYQYKHSPLIQKNKFRVIALLPGAQRDDLCGTMKHIRITAMAASGIDHTSGPVWDPIFETVTPPSESR